ncbi:carbohydrate sulfotransferase 1 isoform X2 [Nelusetta ayraudi]
MKDGKLQAVGRMECSWKMLLLLALAFLAVQYTAIRTLRDSLNGPCQGAHRCHSRHHGDSRWRGFCDDRLTSSRTSRKHVLLMAVRRSGSSFAGQLLNRHPGIYYFYEPLYHLEKTFGKYRPLLGAYRDLLLNLYNCDLHFMEQYISPKPQDHVTSSYFRWWSTHALCSPPVCSKGAEELGPEWPNEIWCTEKCGPLNLTVASMSCLSKEHIVIKTVRIAQVKHLRSLMEDPRMDLRIIHLVRDPRAIMASRMTTFQDEYLRVWKIWNSTGRKPRYVDLTEITSICKDMAASAEMAAQGPPWLHGRYLLVRYEDLAFKPEEKAAEIYRFLGLEMEDQVRTWIAKSTNGSALSKLMTGNARAIPYSIDSKATATSWRLQLRFDIARTLQDECNSTLALLGYRHVHSAAELRNLSHSLMENRT